MKQVLLLGCNTNHSVLRLKISQSAVSVSMLLLKILKGIDTSMCINSVGHSIHYQYLKLILFRSAKSKFNTRTIHDYQSNRLKIVISNHHVI